MRQGGPMDFEGSAVLLWWANGSLAIAASVEVQVTGVSHGWVAQVSAVSPHDFWGLVVLGGPFQLKFEDGSVFEVGVGDPDDFGVFPLWGWEEEGDHRRPCPDCASDLVRTKVVEGAGEITLHDACSGCGRGFERSISLAS